MKTTIKIFFYTLMTVFLAPYVAHAKADESLKIASDHIVATVDGHTLSSKGVMYRANLIRLSDPASASYSQHQIDQIALRQLIDEYLKTQEANNFGIVTPSPKSIEEEINRLAQLNHLTLKEFTEKIQNAGASIEDLKTQIYTSILWARYIRVLADQQHIFSSLSPSSYPTSAPSTVPAVEVLELTLTRTQPNENLEQVASNFQKKLTPLSFNSKNAVKKTLTPQSVEPHTWFSLSVTETGHITPPLCTIDSCSIYLIQKTTSLPLDQSTPKTSSVSFTAYHFPYNDTNKENVLKKMKHIQYLLEAHKPIPNDSQEFSFHDFNSMALNQLMEPLSQQFETATEGQSFFIHDSQSQEYVLYFLRKKTVTPTLNLAQSKEESQKEAIAKARIDALLHLEVKTLENIRKNSIIVLNTEGSSLS